MALFSTNVQPQSSHLVEFMAGKMFMREKMVHPDPRRGKIYLYQSDDGLMHFCWKDATSGTVEDDLIIFPDDTEFKRISECTTGRVYLLSFKNPPRKFFYWMQSVKDDKDEDHCKKVNDLLNHPPVVGPGGRRGAHEAGGIGDQMNMFNQLLSGGSGGEDLQRALQGVDRRQMMQLLNLMGAGSGASLADLVGSGGTGAESAAGGGLNRRLPPSSAQSAIRSAGAAAGRSSAAAAAAGQSSTSSSNVLAAATTPTTGSSNNSGANKPAARPITTSELSQILSGINASGAGTPRVEDANSIAEILEAEEAKNESDDNGKTSSESKDKKEDEKKDSEPKKDDQMDLD